MQHGEAICFGRHSAKAGTPVGLAALLAKQYPGKQWSYAGIPGPHRGRYVFQILDSFERFLRDHGGKCPDSVLISVGGADAAAQTPLIDFQRGLDALIDRIRRAGGQQILFVGVLPEPELARQAEIYQEQLAELARENHVPLLDVLARWIAEPDWSRRYKLEPEYGAEPNASVYSATPNGAAREEIAKMIWERWH